MLTIHLGLLLNLKSSLKADRELLTIKTSSYIDLYYNCINKQRKRLRSNFFESKVSHLKETTPSLWWKEVKRIPGMVPSADTENLLAQLRLENVEEDIQGADLANRINIAF